MAVTVASFRDHFPAFKVPDNADPQTAMFPDAVIQRYIDLAPNLLNACRWGNLLDYATELFVAHETVLDEADNRAVDVNGLPGVTPGLVAAKSAGDVSLSYDTGSTLEPGAGHWNLTRFGKKLYHYMMILGAGPVQVGPSCGSSNPMDSINAWPGIKPGPWGGNW